MGRQHTARGARVVGPDGRAVSLESQPLVAFSLSCGHLGREYAVARRDLIFCDACGVTRRVSKILAQ